MCCFGETAYLCMCRTQRESGALTHFGYIAITARGLQVLFISLASLSSCSDVLKKVTTRNSKRLCYVTLVQTKIDLIATILM